MSNFIFHSTRIKNYRAIDADTIEVEIDLGFKIWTKQTLRLARVNAWEKRGPEKEKGLKAKAFVEEILANASPESIKAVTYKAGRYGRFLVDIWVNEVNLNNLLIEKGHAREYNPSKVKKPKKIK